MREYSNAFFSCQENSFPPVGFTPRPATRGGNAELTFAVLVISFPLPSCPGGVHEPRKTFNPPHVNIGSSVTLAACGGGVYLPAEFPI